MTTLKVCGLTTVDHARACASLGVHAVGVRLGGPPGGPAWALAAAIVDAVGDRTLVVGVVDARAPDDELDRLKRATGVGCLQIEGRLAPERLARHLPHAYLALPLAALAGGAPPAGDYVMARVEPVPGGDDREAWAALRSIARAKRLAVSGPFAPDSAREALRRVGPFCLDLRPARDGAEGFDLRHVEALLGLVREAPPAAGDPP